MERRIAAMSKAPADVGGDEKPAESVPMLGSPGGTDAGAESGSEGPAKPGSPKEAPAPTVVPDLKFVDEKFRQFVEESKNPEFQAYVARIAREDSEGRLRFDDYTRKNMARSEAEKQLAARKVAADFGESIMARKELLALVQAEADRLDGKEPVPEFDPVTATAEDWKKERQRLKEEAKRDVLQELEGRSATVSSEQRLRLDVSAGVLDSLKDVAKPEVVNEMFVRLGDWDGVKMLLSRRGLDFNASNVAATLREFLPATPVAAPPKDSPPVTERPGNATTGASALTRGGGVAPTPKAPAHILAGRKAASPKELAEETVYEVNRTRAAQGKPLIALPWSPS